MKHRSLSALTAIPSAALGRTGLNCPVSCTDTSPTESPFKQLSDQGATRIRFPEFADERFVSQGAYDKARTALLGSAGVRPAR